jgi:hypothetical protein
MRTMTKRLLICSPRRQQRHASLGGCLYLIMLYQCLFTCYSYSLPSSRINFSLGTTTTTTTTTNRLEYHPYTRLRPSLFRHRLSSISLSDGIDDTKTKHRHECWSNFQFGATQVHSNYLKILWKNSILPSLLVVAPTITVLSLAQYVSPHFASVMYYISFCILTGLYNASTKAALLLQLPIGIFLSIYRLLPTFLVVLADYLPRQAVILCVRALLFFQMALRRQSQMMIGAILGGLVWNPLLEEFCYRYVLDRLIGDRSLLRSQPRPASTLPTEEFIPIPGHSQSVDTTDPSDLVSSKDSDKELWFGHPPWILLSTFLFATSHLGSWLLPDTHILAGLVQSAIVPLSSQTRVELQPLLQKMFLGLALTQSISSWFVSLRVLSPLYQQHGLAASMGAHVVWTISLVTLPIRLFARLFAWCFPKRRRI